MGASLDFSGTHMIVYFIRSRHSNEAVMEEAEGKKKVMRFSWFFFSLSLSRGIFIPLPLLFPGFVFVSLILFFFSRPCRIYSFALPLAAAEIHMYIVFLWNINKTYTSRRRECMFSLEVIYSVAYSDDYFFTKKKKKENKR